MKKLVLVMLVVFTALSIQAQSSIAATDDFLAPKINPAAVGFGNAGGFSFIGKYDEDGFYQDNYSIIIGGEGLSYVLDRIENDNYHRLALSSAQAEMMNNLYLGFNWDWKNKYFGDGRFGQSLLFRPADFLSIGVQFHDLFYGKTSYDFGVAVKPLIFDPAWANRITLSLDSFYDQEDLIKPKLGIQSELFNGICLGGSFDLDSETLGLNLGIRFDKFSLGSFLDADSDSKFTSGRYYVNISKKNFRSVLDSGKNSFVNYKFKDILETKPGQKVGPFTIFLSQGKPLSEVIKDLDKMKKDETIKGIVIQNANFSAKLAQREELRDAFQDFRASGKKVVFYFESLGGANYAFAASIADAIYLNPIGMIDFKGLSVNSPYLKSLLDTLGVDIINLRSHDYKTAGNMLSEDHMTEAERESYQYLLEGIFQELAAMIEEGRGERLKFSVREMIDKTPFWTAEEALAQGLIDGVIFQDELKKELEEEFDSNKIVEKYKKKNFTYKWSKENRERVALIYAIGNIHSGKGISGSSIGSVTTAAAIKKAREDKTIKGIILRVDSGGGSALASDVIAREMELCKTGKNKKPVVVSMGGVAASGGYYISTYADKIVAQPSTITGSIGVVGVFPILERLYQKILINWDTVNIGRFADFGSTSRMPTGEERDLFNGMIHHYYDRFIRIVAESRNMEKDKVHEYAQGRIWTGRQALERGLIDAIGGMDIAQQEMQALLNTKRKIELIEEDSHKSFGQVGFSIDASAFIPTEMIKFWNYANHLKTFQDDNIQMILPYVPSID